MHYNIHIKYLKGRKKFKNLKIMFVWDGMKLTNYKQNRTGVSKCLLFSENGTKNICITVVYSYVLIVISVANII